MKTFLGLEVNFCEECGQPLEEVVSHDKRSIIGACPDWINVRPGWALHSMYVLRENTERVGVKFDPITGKKVGS